MSIEVTEKGRCRTITHASNPRIHYVEWKCKTCGERVAEEEVVWARPDGTLDTDRGDPYCVSDAPEEPEEE